MQGHNRTPGAPCLGETEPDRTHSQSHPCKFSSERWGVGAGGCFSKGLSSQRIGGGTARGSSTCKGLTAGS